MRYLLFLLFPLFLKAQDTVKVSINMTAEQQADLDYNKGLSLLKEKDFHGAVDLFTKSLANKTAFDKALASRAIAYSNLKKYGEAINDINAAIQLQPTSEHYLNKSLIYMGMNVPDSQEVALDLSLSKNQENADAAYYKGMILFKRGDYDRAIGYYSMAILARRDFVFAYNDRASSKRAKGDLAGAIEDYERALTLDSSNAFILNNLGSAYRLYKSYEKSVRYHTAALRRDPNYLVALLNRGAAYFDSGDYKKAQTDFEEVLRRDPKNSSAYNNIASIALKNNDFNKAKEMASRAIDNDKNNGAAYYNRGIARQMLRDEDGCCDDWKSALKLGIEGARSFLNASCNQ